MTKRLFDIVISLTLTACAFIAYSNTFDASFQYDDYISIVLNESIQMEEFSWGRLLMSHVPGYPFDRPLAWMSFALNYYFGGLDPFGYHLVNILIHIITGTGVYLLIKITLELRNAECGMRSIQNESGFIAALAALLWLVSPVQTQSVTYVVQRMASMAAMFYVFSFLFYIRWRTGKGGALYLLASISFFIAAIATKQNGITLPIVLLIFEAAFFRHSWKEVRILSMILVCILLAAAFLFMAGLRPGSFFKPGYAMQERLFSGARVVNYYIGTLLFPVPSRLALVHDFPLSRGLITPPATLPALGLVAGAGILSLYRIRRDPFFFFFSLWFFINILPETMYPGIDLLYEHRLYLPSVGFYAIFVSFIWRVVKGKAAVGTAIFLSALFLINTYGRNTVWHDEISLWEDTAKKSPLLPVSHEGLGIAYLNTGELEKAEEELKIAKRLNPLSPLASVGLARVYQRKGDARGALTEVEYLSSRRRMGFDVYYHGMEVDMYNMRRGFLLEGRPAEAERILELWFELKPESEEIEGLPKLKVAR